ncbi:Saccharopine dehydrogenase-domain-containing protein [Hygrophoropsis aurantiaca]|uniref:Saccharopine dehydrogenase-domain-containing protein n=1 Tax=Hygrophoropsis aurantiaca TaxID=72124 RepID=A0ACB7ZWN9_9AGAM|nr:Saccharopine dehydrogenase-domain-containing protein [Hygrophoropsis aurantiaca]
MTAGLRRSPHSLSRTYACRHRHISSPHPSRHAFSTSAASSASQLTIGIRREDPSRIWERRCPVTPDAVHELVHKDNVNVLIQDCDRRVFPVDQFVKAGAQVHSTLEPAQIILGIKETPLNELITTPVSASISSLAKTATSTARTHLMFSHTTKGQAYNMELLSRFLGTNAQASLLPRLIDYEMLTGEDGKRTVGFGWFAGVAGALESLSALAQAHLELGVASPFLHTPRPHTHPSVHSLRAALRAVGQEIIQDGTPKSLGPFVIGLTGNGQVSQGVLSILAELPIVNVNVENLPSLVSDPGTDLHKIYLVRAHPQDYLSRNDGGQYSRSDYYENPGQYQSNFDTKVAPYLTLFLNGVGWLPAFPRLMINAQLTTALTRASEVGRGRFGTIGDISCDVEGGLEFMPRSSTICKPFFTHRPATLPSHLPSVQIMSVDILPSSVPLDASQHFCKVLMPYLRALIGEHRGTTGAEDLKNALDIATIARGGVLQGKHAWLNDPVDAWRKSAASTSASTVTHSPATLAKPLGVKKKKVLMLGSGMVAGPAVDQICKRRDVELLVGSNSRSEGNDLVRAHSNASATLVDVTDLTTMSTLINEADVVISLLPVPFHPSVAELCIQHGKHLVTASYISPAMRDLHERAESANVLLLNEIGLDPGVDHCSALSLLGKLKDEKKRVVSFTSFCGGLPAPEHADGPLGYKFSWSPRGVLNAALNGARFKLRGTTMEIPGNNLLKHYFPEVPVSNVLKFEGLANRDSLPYAETYNLGKIDNLTTVLRGTLRYPGFTDLMHSFTLMGLLQADAPSLIQPACWSDLGRLSLEKQLGTPIPNEARSFLSAMRTVMNSEQTENALRALDQLTSSSNGATLPALPHKPSPPIELFTSLLAHQLNYRPGERDLVVLAHEIIAQPESSLATEVHTSSLITYGTANASAMSRCVGLPVAFAALKVLDGEVSVRGVHGPTDQGLYEAVLDGLQEVGLDMEESVRAGNGMETVLSEGLAGKMSTL